MTKAATILIADDDRSIRTVLTKALARQGYDVRTTGHAATLWQWASAGEGDLVITDVVMPDENGLDLLSRLKRLRPELRVIVMSAQSTLLTAVKATERGAFEYLPKPFDLNELLTAVDRALKESKPSKIDHVAQSNHEQDAMPLIGRSPAMQNIYRVMARLMNTDLTVLITGESGTGKELVARALHDYGHRRNGPFVALNMAAIPRELIESELFGHEKGAFTGAVARYAGRFEQAQGGTLFLDEIGDMPIEAQTRLLRVLQEGEYTAVGGRSSMTANVRIITATHRDLRQMIKQGLFREDLYYRLNVVPMRLPPLRERPGDIADLVQHFIQRSAEAKEITPEAIDRLKQYYWPGNVRELENMINRLCALYNEKIMGVDLIESELAEYSQQFKQDNENTQGALQPVGPALQESTLGDLVHRQLKNYFQAHGNQLPADGLYDRIVQEVERPLIQLTLKATGGNQIKSAQILGINRNTLRKKIKDLDVIVMRGQNWE
jgi:two-component system nitrogen regulation response regulator GlnG